jgi:hypothetical protein
MFFTLFAFFGRFGLLFIFPVEVVLKDKTDTLYGVGLTQRIFVNGVRKCFRTELAIGCEQVLYVQIAKEWAIAEIIVSISKVAVDYQLADWVNLEVGFVLLTGCLAFSIGSEIKSHSKYIRQFAEPGVDLSCDSG